MRAAMFDNPEPKTEKTSIEYTIEDIKKLTPYMEKLMKRIDREQPAEATKAMMELLGKYLEITLGVE